MSFLDEDPSTAAASTAPLDPPRSPYSASRALLRDLTLPAVPNMDIPPSPPGSPPPSLDALNDKFDTFLRLKRTKGVHFNERLAASSAGRNPALMDKLLGFVGIETEFDLEGGGGDVAAATEQYATTLGTDIWNPAAFPEWAYKGPLRNAQERGHKERERGRGEPVEFVSASTLGAGSGSAPGSRPDTPGTTGAVKRKSRFDA